MPARKIITITQLIVVLLGSAVIKLYYSTASVNDLLWILAPTRFLVELATGVRFYLPARPFHYRRARSRSGFFCHGD